MSCRLQLAAILGLVSGCSADDAPAGDAAAADARTADASTIDAPGVDAAPMLSPQGMVAFACPGGVCPASRIVAYWRDQWDDHAVRRTVTFVETSDTVFVMQVTDGNGDPATLAFEAGVPVTLTLRNPGDGSTAGKHFLTAPELYRAVAWYKADTADAEYLAPHFDAFAVVYGAGVDHEVRLYFVPMTPGTYDSYCQILVPDGGNYAGIVAGTVEPDLADPVGHAGKGMKTTVAVTGDLGVTLNQGVHPLRNPALDGDPRRSSFDPVWTGATTIDIGMVEISDVDLAFNPLGFSMTLGGGYILSLTNPGTNLSRHVYSARDFYMTTVMRMATDSQGEVRASYLTAVQLEVGGLAQLYLVPTVAGSFVPYCQIGVQGNPDGPDLTTGHAGRGMIGSVTVAP